MRLLVVAVAVVLHYTMAGSPDLVVTQASNRFASRLYQELAKTPGNVLVCPLSLHIALALVHQGAGGATRTELGQVLQFPPNSNVDIKHDYKTLLTGLQDDVLKIATKLFPANSFKPKPQYTSVAQQYFLSDVQSVDYGKSVEAAMTINKFVENKTNNKIHDIVSADSLNDATRLVIVNAVHFKANWAKTFPPAFTDNFKVTPTQTVKTEFLGQTDYFPYKEDPALGAKVLKLDYENGKYSMVFVLPNKEDGLPELEAKLATTSMDSLLAGLKSSRVDVTIPKFKIEKEMQMKEYLIKMGITHMFDSRADLSNLADGENLFVSSVIQKTFIDVNEKGTEAAAATGIVTPLSGGTEENTFIARSPFYFYLISNRIPVILFDGRFVIPTKTTEKGNKYLIHFPSDEETEDLILINRFGNEEDTISNNEGNGMSPNVNHNQNFYQPNVLQNYEQTTQNNRFNQNKYPKPITHQTNYGQHNKQSFNPNSYHQHFPPYYGQNNQFAPVNHNQNPLYHTGQYSQPTPPPTQHYETQPTGQYHQNIYHRPSIYQPQYQSYGLY